MKTKIVTKKNKGNDLHHVYIINNHMRIARTLKISNCNN